jgi:PKD repeat protein
LDVPDERENITFNASKSKDIGGKIVAYKWDFGDGNRTDRLSTPEILHSYARGGSYTVSLTVQDNEDATSTSSRNITINNLPQANFTITPQKPVVGSQVRFDASGSWDEEDGKNLAYHWEINNNSAIFNLASPPKQVYDEAGMYWVNLTVSDMNGAAGHKNYLLKINQPPVARIAFDSANLSQGMMVNFTAALSEDPDGKIIGYTWDFGDNRTVDHNESVLHSYLDGGKMLVRLSVVDNDGATADVLQEIFINKPPVAMFSIDPVEPEKGELVSFDASESDDFDGDIKKFLWDFGVGRAEPEVYYSEFAEHTYNRPMKYNVTLTIVDNNGATASISQMVEVRENNNRPNVENLRPDAQSPRENGSIVTWTAVASDKESDPLQYQFILDGQVVQDWSDRSTWVWTADQAGVHTIEAQARDGKHGMQGDSSKSASFEIFEIIVLPPPNNAPVITSLSADKVTPQETGSIITWTAQASDPENDPILYRFFLNGLVATDWQFGNQWAWTMSEGEAQIGVPQIGVQIRDGKHADQYGFDDQKSVNFVLPPNDKPVITSFESDKLSPQQTGSTITWTVVSMDSDEDPLQFQFILDGQVMQDWSDSSVWSWTATRDQVGAHVVTAKVRDGKHNPEEDSTSSVNGFIITQDSSIGYVESAMENWTTNASMTNETIAYPVEYAMENCTTNASMVYTNETIAYPVEYATENCTTNTSMLSTNEAIADPVINPVIYAMENTTINASEAYVNETIAYPAFYVGPPDSSASDSIATIVSQEMRGYQVFLDDNYIGTEGELWDAPDGRFTFSVAGNQMHSIRIYDGQFNYPKSIFFQSGEIKTINVEPGTPIYA